MSKKIILGIILVAVVVAMPVYVYAKTTNWIAAIDSDFTNAGNWSNDVPVSGDTVQFLDSTASSSTLNLPNSGQIFDIVIRDEVGSGFNWTTAHPFLGDGDWGYTSLILGDESHHHDILELPKDSVEGGVITSYGYLQTETIYVLELPNSIINVKSGGRFEPLSPGANLGQSVTIEEGGHLSLSASSTVTMASPLYLGGLMDTCGPSMILDNAQPIEVTSDTTTINWINGNLIVYGGLNAGGHTIVHINAIGASLIVDQNGVLDLGTANNNVAGLAVQLAATAHLTKNWYMAGMTIALGTGTLIADNDLTIDGASATSITSTASKIYANGHAVTVKNLGDKAVTCYGCIDGGGNGASVVFVYSNATVTSSTYTVSALSGGTGTIMNVPYDTSKTTFETALTKGESHQTWNDSNIDDPVVSGNTLTITAQDGTTTATYTITVNDPVCTESNWTSSVSPETCPSSGQQTKTWTKSGTCSGGATHSATETVSCTYVPPSSGGSALLLLLPSKPIQAQTQIEQIKAKLIMLITQLIQLLTLQVSQLPK